MVQAILAKGFEDDVEALGPLLIAAEAAKRAIDIVDELILGVSIWIVKVFPCLERFFLKVHPRINALTTLGNSRLRRFAIHILLLQLLLCWLVCAIGKFVRIQVAINLLVLVKIRHTLLHLILDVVGHGEDHKEQSDDERSIDPLVLLCDAQMLPEVI